MKKIKDIISKLSEALEAMIAGLQNQSKRGDFEISMSTYGDYVPDAWKVCFGCAATCTVQELVGKNYYGREIGYTESRANYLGVDKDDLYIFERAVNEARSGFMVNLFVYFQVPDEYRNKIDLKINLCMTTDGWPKEIPKLEKYIKKLKRVNL